jgi:hypothetical protein
MKRLGMPVGDDTILRHLKRQVGRRWRTTTLRVAGIDDWSWRKGRTYGTIIVDLERREVVDLLQDRTATGTAEWLGQHPEVEIVSRDRCGLYAQGARAGASQARQVADRFHVLQNLRETIETQLSRVDRPTGRALLPESNDEDVAATASCPGGWSAVVEHRLLTRQAHRRSRQAIFDQIHSLRRTAFCPKGASRSRRRHKCSHRGVGQRSDRRAHQSIENAEARDVRSRRARDSYARECCLFKPRFSTEGEADSPWLRALPSSVSRHCSPRRRRRSRWGRCRIQLPKERCPREVAKARRLFGDG